jgi:hypothetical protein
VQTQRAELGEALVMARRWVPFNASERQITALTATFDGTDPDTHFLYGGAAGGGKSAALLIGALQHVHYPGHAALLIRDELPEMKLPGGLMALAEEWAARMDWTGQGAKWVPADRQWVFPSGATVTFGYAAKGKHVRYLGSDFSFVGIDEAVLVSQLAIREIWGRIRRTVPFTRRLVLASNPGGRSHKFLLDEFVEQGRLIQSLAVDNPGLDATAYLELLSRSQIPSRFRQLAEGSWAKDENPDAFWSWDMIRRGPEPTDFDRIVVAVDPTVGSGGGDECGIIVAGSVGTDIWVLDDRSVAAHPDVWAPRVLQTAEDWGASQIHVETDQGGELYRPVFRTAAETLSQTRETPMRVPGLVFHRAREWGDKATRAGWAALYYPNHVWHAERLADGPLETQMVTWVPGQPGSPDRLDATVWAVRVLSGASTARRALPKFG